MENIFIRMEIPMKVCGLLDKKEGEGTFTYNNDRYTYVAHSLMIYLMDGVHFI